MKLFVLTILAAVVLTLPLCAQIAVFQVPFEFTVGMTTVPPGNYVIRNSAGSTTIEVVGSDLNNHHFSQFLATHRDDVRNASLEPRLVFHRYGNQYFLSQVWSGTSKSGVPVTQAERELRRNSVTAAKLIVLSMR